MTFSDHKVGRPPRASEASARLAGLGSRRRSAMQWREALQGYAFISPWVIGFLAFTLGPMVASFYYSFADYHIQRPPVFVGLRNYIYAFAGDRLFWHSVTRTLYWSLLTVPLGIIGSLMAAILLDQGLKGTAFYRTSFFLPSLTPVIAASLLWTWILQPDVGLMNTALSAIGIRGPRWFSSVQWAMPALAMIALWNGIGGGRMLIFLAGLQGIPESLYEAADIDGAGFWHKHWNITLPMISPSMFFNVVLGLIGSFQVFDMAYVTTAGGPAYATHFYALHLYRQAFVSFDMGYGSTLAWILFFAIFILTLAQLKLQTRWVYYEGELS